MHAASTPGSRRNAPNLQAPVHTEPQVSQPADPSPDPSALVQILAQARRDLKLLRVIPRGVRETCAATYTAALADFNTRLDRDSWNRLMVLPSLMFTLPLRRVKNSTLCKIIRDNVADVQRKTLEGVLATVCAAPLRKSKADLVHQRTAQAERKLAEGDVRSAVRALMSSDSIALTDDETEQELKSKHPPLSGTSRERIETLQGPAPSEPSRVPESAVLEAVRSFAPASAAGLDGLRPRHLRDMLDKTIPPDWCCSEGWCRGSGPCSQGVLRRRRSDTGCC